MADNMIELVASLNVDDSAKQINKVDIPKLQEKIEGIKIKCELDTEGISSIQSQLENISKNLKLDIGGFTFDKNIDNAVSVIQNSLSNIKSGIKIPVDIDENAIENVGDSLRNLGLESKDIERLTKYFQDLDVTITKIKPKFVELAGSGGEKILDSLSISGVDRKTGGIINIVDQLDNIEGKTAKTTYTITQNLAKVEQENKKIEDSAKAAQLAYNDFLKLKGQADVYSKQYAGEDSLKTQLTDIQKLIGEFDNTQPLEKQREGIINIDNALKLLKVDIDNIKKASTSVTTKGVSDFYPNIAKGASTQDTISNAKNTLNELFAKTAGMEEDTANRVKRAVEDTTGALQRFYVQVERGDKSVETLTYALNEQGNAYEYLGKTIREADNSTDFRRKDITTQWDIQTQKLQQFITNAEKAGAASTVLSDDIANLKSKLDSKGDTSAMNSFLDDFDIAKAKFQAFNAEVRKDNAITNFNNKIKKLSADMNAYAATNQRAVESTKKMTSGTTFVDEWVRLTGLMAKGANLTDTELRNLIADMAVFKKESKSAGLEGASAFERFANSFKVISTYISANQIINRVISQIREGITELKEIDNILTEISKTSDRTTESLRRLGQASFDVASNYGRTASDYLLGVQEMSRAGFGEVQSEQLAELSLRAQAAGDMTAEMANQYIIATNAAYALAGNEDKLNQVLDSQNYITNHNAVNMENLAQATKIAASQASASGVAIDELTAAAGTMVAVTQQGGDQAGRAFKGILMNIQQVKASAADIGDGGEDITTESLSKYEKATAALGVSLKEVRNGTLQLREPMEVLRDLSEAVRKESEGSIKVANLISAVGGKFRGNQLIALLQNWETYEKMLSEFNSDKAIGSAMDEAEKSANNWAGSINKVKNSWAELTSKFADSDNMISIINSINAIIQSLSDSATTGALRTLSEAFTGVFKAVSFLTDKLGALPTLLTTIATINSIRGKGIFGGESIDSLGGVIQRANGSLKKYLVSLDAAKLKTIALRAATVAFEAALTLGITWAISKLIEAYDKFANAEERWIEQQKQAQQEIIERVRAYSDEINENKDLSASYIELISTTSDLTSEKEKLLEIQEKINNGIENQTDKVDLLNKSLSENIELTSKQRLKEAEKIISENQATYENVIKGENASYVAMQTYGDRDVAKAISEIEYATGRRISGTLKEQSQQLEEILKLYHDIDGYNKQYYNDVVKGKQAIDATLSEWAEIKGVVESARKTVQELTISPETQESFNGLVDKAKQLYDEINGEGTVDQKFLASEKLKELRSQLYELVDGNSELTQIADTIFTSFDNGVESAVSSVGNLKEAWLATLDDMQKGSLKNISTMVSALQDLSEGKGIAANTFWNLIEFDTEGLLNGAKLVGDKFYITQENMIKLKDQYIQKEIESLKNTQTDVKLQKDKYDELVSQYELEVAILQMRGTNPLSSEMVTARSNLEKAKRSAKEFGDEWERNNWLIEYLNQTLGNTVDLEKELQAQQKALNKEITALNNELDDILKAQEHQIDSIVKGLEIEQSTLEAQKEALEDELDVLEKQKDTLEEIVGNYDKVNTLVQNTLQKEIDVLEAEKDSIEEAYKKRIDALKEENEQRSDALEYAQKLANLENAKNNKVRVIDSTRGFRYESVREDVVKAEKELKDYETEKEIKQLEKERDAEIKVRDERIKNIETYAQDWKNMAQDVTDAQTEIIAQELLGSNWREGITNLDIETLEKFRNEYTNHNNVLNNLTNNEIKLKKAAIDAKNAEIDAKKRQIEVWKNYKKEVQNAVQDIKNEYSTYMEKLGTVEIDEKSNLDRREHNLDTFKNNVRNIISQISEKQAEVDRITASLEGLESKSIGVDVTVTGVDELEKAANEAAKLAAASAATYAMADEVKKRQVQNAGEEIAQVGEDIIKRINGLFGFSEGGVADYTGLAMLHGRRNAPETIFNANDSAKLYEMVHNTPNLMADMIAKATKISGFNLAKTSGDTQNSNEYSFYIDKIVTDSPENFAKQLDRYYQTKLTESYTNK